MKTFILQLEQHDDFISARDKMEWAKSGRILLVWPERGRVLNRRLDLVLLQRHSTSLGAPLALVTNDPDVRYYAPRLGIPVYKSLRQAQNAHWRVPRRFRSPENSQATQTEGTLATPGESRFETLLQLRPYREFLPKRPERKAPKQPALTRLISFTLGVMALLSIAATLLPSAQVVLSPQDQSQETTIEVWASPDIRTTSISGAMPARRITVIVEGRASLFVSGAILVPDRSAIGYVKFTNLTDQPVDVPEGAVVRTVGGDRFLPQNPIRFTVTQAGEVLAGPGQSLTVPVRCLTPGSQGNLAANNLIAIEGLLGTQLSVTNPEPTQHGTERRELAPTQADRRKLASQLREDLEQAALKEIQNTLQGGDLLIPSSLELLQTLEESYQPADLQPADRLSISQRQEYRAMFVSAEDVYTLAQAVLDASLPKGFTPVQSSLKVENLSTPILGEGAITRWKLHAIRQIQAQIQEPQAIRLVLGLEPGQAKAHLEASLPLKEPPRINLFPSWWPRLPFIPFRIVIIH